MHRRALAIKLKVLGEGHPSTANSYNNLAATLGQQGKYAEAEAMHRRALAIRLKALGTDHPDTANSYNNLAATLRAQGKYAEAEAMFRRALAIYAQGPGRGPPRHRQELQQPGRDPLCPGEVRRGRGDAPPRPGDPAQGPGRRATPTPPAATQIWPDLSTLKASTTTLSGPGPRPRRVTNRPGCGAPKGSMRR